ncbi:transcriptional regulator [Alkalihalobacillus alcalophilus ATCC 27647 = CGMCC 1.3604]|uniref:Transcriptional regulator n=1 Tax=Alkalihalobacillus alcalophilus ATCC 27647 = CGMCC 1.3604 TaxID=1218173 RepID=A0A094YSY1_ALKAL|nr:BMP family ABC transporter substrate-binding protein [Alkalihalobacillus alcalophilus]KGA96597.1 transcriptional regulator [Alkalihalobacillus alcalophilus ATCC 27647 = CGMCC 1.3604]MED1563768.1 BMP family ABC transporter substrate-binding protein [Alkalihalobacillus alcalophilus]THG89352.1 transcriptional regulator [Alkalihalobacillus alcalophilus ATCC 27647 = CGMCC 1.3604]
MLKQKKWLLFIPLFIIPILFIGCIQTISTADSNNVGLMLEDTINDQGWNRQGYDGLLRVHSQFNLEVFYKEEIQTIEQMKYALEEFEQNNVSLVFGHGKRFADAFTELAKSYPEIHFVVFNGEVEGENITSFSFDGYAMGYFAGVLSAIMTQNDEVGVIAAFPWQPEIQGFVDGVQFQNEQVEVTVEHVLSWQDQVQALTYYEQMKGQNVDIIYPIGDGFHIDIIEKSKKDGLYVIGYISDQSDLGEASVLTSTIQHVEDLYVKVVEQFVAGQLEAGNYTLDFQEEVISLGQFSSQVPEEVAFYLLEAIQYYMETGEKVKMPYLH